MAIFTKKNWRKFRDRFLDLTAWGNRTRSPKSEVDIFDMLVVIVSLIIGGILFLINMYLINWFRNL